MQKLIRPLLARPSLTLAASDYCKPPPRGWRAKGRSASTIAITISTATTRPPCSCFPGWKPRCAIPTCERNSTAALKPSPATRLIKTKPSTSNCACGKRATGCRRSPLARGILAVPACLMRNTLLPAKPGDRLTSRSALAGGIWEPAET